MESLFTPQDRERIAEAVRAAEQRTSGEIVPFVAPLSARYEVATWRGAVGLALLALAVSLVVKQLYAGWGLAWLFEGWAMALVTVAAGVVGAALARWVAPLRRALVGEARLAEAVHHAAMKAFVEEEVFATKDRTGILLYLSLFEHRIEVLGDSGINAAVPEDAWADVVLAIRAGIRRGEPAAGLIEGIRLCGDLLEHRGVDVRPDDIDELPNTLRFRKP